VDALRDAQTAPAELKASLGMTKGALSMIVARPEGKGLPPTATAAL
jgi:hypothetical protein